MNSSVDVVGHSQRERGAALHLLASQRLWKCVPKRVNSKDIDPCAGPACPC